MRYIRPEWKVKMRRFDSERDAGMASNLQEGDSSCSINKLFGRSRTAVVDRGTRCYRGIQCKGHGKRTNDDRTPGFRGPSVTVTTEANVDDISSENHRG